MLKINKKKLLVVSLLVISSIFLFGCNKKVKQEENIELKDTVDKVDNNNREETILETINTNENESKEYITAVEDFSSYENPEIELGQESLNEFEKDLEEEINNIDFSMDMDFEY